MSKEIYVPLSALNVYNYCRYRVYLEFVLKEWEDNFHTIESILKHERAHAGERRYDNNRKQTTQVFVRSDKYRLMGKIDVVEEKNNLVYPVEYKKGRPGRWLNDHLQLCAQALCLEEHINQNITHGYLWYFSTRSREQVKISQELRQKTIQASQEILKILKQKIIPENKYTKKCKACSLNKICLPQETAILNKKRGS